MTLFLYKEVMKTKREKIYYDLLKDINDLGYNLVDFINKGITKVKIKKTKKEENYFNFEAIIHKKEGITSDDCTYVYKIIYPKMQIILDQRNINLEISSAGLDRLLKYNEELDFFLNYFLSITYNLDKDNSENIQGTLKEVIKEENIYKHILIEIDDNIKKINISDIIKAKLHY